MKGSRQRWGCGDFHMIDRKPFRPNLNQPEIFLMHLNQLNAPLTAALTLALGVSISAPASAWTALAPDAAQSINVLTADNKPCTNDKFGSFIDSDEIVAVSSIKSEIVANAEGSDISSCLSYGKTAYGTNEDVGTNDLSGDKWYRPSARNSNGAFEEKGFLEVGTFTFDLEDKLSSRGGQLLFRFLDVEGSWAETGVTVAGQFHRLLNKSGGDDVIHEMILDMADVFTISVGKDTSGTGDGVNFQIFAKFNEPEDETSVPEPSMLLGMVAIAGLTKVRRRR